MHEHQRGDVHDLRVKSAVSEVLLDREPADWIHLVDRGDINAVAVAQVSEQHVVTFAEVVDAGSMQQKEVSLESRRYLLIHGPEIPYLINRPVRDWWTFPPDRCHGWEVISPRI